MTILGELLSVQISTFRANQFQRSVAGVVMDSDIT